MLNSIIKKGILFVISAPSGAGKTTIARMILKTVPHIHPSISHTTRSPRNDEIDGKDYHFTSVEKFNEMIDRGEFIEWAKVFGNLYGTSIHNLDIVDKEKKDLLLVIDVQGAEQLKKLYQNGCYIFILPPSLKKLEERLKDRGLDTEEVIKKRLNTAPDEISHYKSYDYVIINNHRNEAAQQLQSIIFAERCRHPNITLNLSDFQS